MLPDAVSKSKVGGRGRKQEKKQREDTVMDAQGYIASIFKTWEPEAEIGPPWSSVRRGPDQLDGAPFRPQVTQSLLKA